MTDIGKLMHDFNCSDPSDMYFDQLALKNPLPERRSER